MTLSHHRRIGQNPSYSPQRSVSRGKCNSATLLKRSPQGCSSKSQVPYLLSSRWGFNECNWPTLPFSGTVTLSIKTYLKQEKKKEKPTRRLNTNLPLNFVSIDLGKHEPRIVSQVHMSFLYCLERCWSTAHHPCRELWIYNSSYC